MSLVLKKGRKATTTKAISDGNGTRNFNPGTLSWLELPRWFLLRLSLIAGCLLQKRRAEAFQYSRHWWSAHRVSSFYNELRRSVGGQHETKNKQTVQKIIYRNKESLQQCQNNRRLKVTTFKKFRVSYFRNYIQNHLSYKTVSALLCSLTLVLDLVVNNY